MSFPITSIPSRRALIRQYRQFDQDLIDDGPLKRVGP